MIDCDVTPLRLGRAARLEPLDGELRANCSVARLVQARNDMKAKWCHMMVMDPRGTTKSYVYQAPTLYVAIFYVFLAAWAVVCVTVLGSIFNTWGLANVFQLFMFAFVLFYTCYFSVAISYRIDVGDEGSIQLTSFRRIIKTRAEEIPLVEGPHFPIGFIRFRLEREKAYLFCLVNNESLKEVLSVIRAENPQIELKRL